jgi:DNA mismatch repair protein MutS
MSGMPHEVVARAEAILSNLEKVYGSGEIVPSSSDKQRTKRQIVKESAAATQQNIQLSMFQLDDPVLVEIRDQIRGLDINSLTPLEALNKLNEIKRITGL